MDVTPLALVGGTPHEIENDAEVQAIYMGEHGYTHH